MSSRPKKQKYQTVGSYEAKTHLPRLLAEVEAGSVIDITRNGHPIAQLIGIQRSATPPVADVIRRMKQNRLGIRLGGLDLSELKKVGRK